MGFRLQRAQMDMPLREIGKEYDIYAPKRFVGGGAFSGTAALMMRFSVKALLERGFAEENIWIAEERKMCCGLGKCGHCKVGKTYICLDGPVFNYVEGRMLMD